MAQKTYAGAVYTHSRLLSALLGLALAGATAGAAGCVSYEQRMSYSSIPSRAMDTRMRFSVYTPPGYGSRERLPLVVFLHGGGDDPTSFDRHGVSALLDRAIEEGRAPRAVILLPQGDNGFWMDWYDRSRAYESWVVGDLMPYAEQRYHTLGCPEHCHVMGVSMGANGALRFALHHPDRFASVTALSGPVLSTEDMIRFVNDRLFAIFIPTHRIFGPPRPRRRIERDDLFLRWREPEDLRGMRLFFGWARGDREEVIRSGERFEEHLRERRIPHTLEVFEGEHKWVSWAPVIARALAVQLGPATERSGSEGGS